MGVRTPTGLSLPGLSGGRLPPPALGREPAREVAVSRSPCRYQVLSAVQGRSLPSACQNSRGAGTVIHFPPSPGKWLVTKFGAFSFKGDFRGP